jgi:predicted PurR-regulated permease PerM
MRLGHNGFASTRFHAPGEAGGSRNGRNEAEQEQEREEEDIDIFPAVDPEGPVHDDPEEDLAPVQPIFGKSDPVPDHQKSVTRIEVPFRTILKIVGTIFGIWLVLQISQILLLVFISFLLALALVPPVRYLQNRGWPRPAAAGATFLVLIGLIVGYFWIIVPPLVDQGQSLVDNFPDYVSRFERVIERYPSINDRYLEIKENGLAEDTQLPWENLIAVGSGIVSRVVNFFFVLVLTFYLLLEGERSYRFLARYCTPRLRYRFMRAFPELTRVVSGYVIGQAINSTLFGVFSFTTLAIAGVPEPLLLAVLAALLDAVPIVGVPIATIPALLLAATVSWPTAIIVLVAYTAYQQFENYVLVPRVFGNTLQVTALSILVGVLIGGQLLGVIGIILSLPLTASIPVLERIWREEVPDPLTLDMI